MSFRPALAALILLLVSAVVPTAMGEEVRLRPKAVLELFTSQGCSSCPPADALLARLARRDDVIALAYHIDYWDYIGWPDTFAHERNTERQRAYAKSWRSNRIYTPQLIVNGAEDMVGSNEAKVTAAIDGASLPVPIGISANGDDLVIDAKGVSTQSRAVVWLVTYLDRAEIDIERGENRGRRIEYAQVVTGRQVVGMWEPETGAHLALPLSEVFSGESNGVAILIQEEKGGLPGAIIGAALYQR